MIRVVVADDHQVVRAGIAHLLSGSDDMEVIASVADGVEAVDACTRTAPDVALLDLEMPNLDGVEATRRIKEAAPDTAVVVFTYFSDRDRIVQALDAGATGYLLKDADPAELEAGIRAAVAGGAPLHPTAAATVLQERSERTEAGLTAREREVLVLVGEGLVNKQIARRLGISEKTVKTHLTRVFQRIGVVDRTQAALWAERHGLLGRPTSTEL
ncbi:MAG TPA: response regulator transcription factor [Actinomycetota bacterium]|nr:response regulator transcription factor [Actinomycetota bacterium]